jgi:hypothetical protein
MSRWTCIYFSGVPMSIQYPRDTYATNVSPRSINDGKKLRSIDHAVSLGMRSNVSGSST